MLDHEPLAGEVAFRRACGDESCRIVDKCGLRKPKSMPRQKTPLRAAVVLRLNATKRAREEGQEQGGEQVEAMRARPL